MIKLQQHGNAKFDAAGVFGGTLGGWHVDGLRPRGQAAILLPTGVALPRSGDEMYS